MSSLNAGGKLKRFNSTGL